MNSFILKLYKNGITSSTLKIIAALSMFLDHFGGFLLERMIIAHNLNVSTANAFIASLLQDSDFITSIYHLDLVLRYIGRISFLIYAFLIVEGFLHTHNLKIYIISLFLFSLISEIPFSLAGSGKLFYWNHQNVFLTLCIGLIVIACFHKIEQHNWSSIQQFLAKGIVLGAGCLLAYGIKCDYDAFGVALIALLYEFRFYRNFGVFAGGMLLTASDTFEITSLFAILPISLYNGERGLRLKYVFYALYPVHIILFYFIARWMGLAMVVVI